MKVESHGEAMTFRVYSADGDGSYYLVDLRENGGRGSCQCVDFNTRCQPLIDQGKPHVDHPLPGRTHCKHLHATILWLGKMVCARSLGKRPEDIYGEK